MADVRIVQGTRTEQVQISRGTNVLALLQACGFPVTAPCGGRGTCGKCRVEIDNGKKRKTVLACRTRIKRDCTIYVPEMMEHGTGSIESGYDRGGAPARSGRTGMDLKKAGYGAAVDLGTTTIVCELYRFSDGKLMGTRSAWNRQAAFGADVISRIHYTQQQADGLNMLVSTVRAQVMEMLGSICREADVPESEVSELFLAGNTIMQHIFAGLPPESIARAPFTPLSFFDDGKFLDAGKWKGALRRPGLQVFLSPCVAGYVGGDITAGLLYSEAWKKPGRHLFIDVGTNGEMALGGADGFVCCSVATGPAFEGAEIACGMTSTPGAVNTVRWDADAPGGGTLAITTIDDAPPAGICGSGLIDLLAVLLELGIVDETGRLLPPEELEEETPVSARDFLDEDENGNGVFYLTADRSVYLTAGDVRKLQLAKAAVMAGIRVLLREEKLSAGDVGTFYLAGGFGRHINPDSAAAIGMFPAELTNRIRYLGNASLAGAARALLDENSRKDLLALKQKCRYVELSGNTDFTEEYMEQMMFGED